MSLEEALAQVLENHGIHVGAMVLAELAGAARNHVWSAQPAGQTVTINLENPEP